MIINISELKEKRIINLAKKIIKLSELNEKSNNPNKVCQFKSRNGENLQNYKPENTSDND